MIPPLFPRSPIRQHLRDRNGSFLAQPLRSFDTYFFDTNTVHIVLLVVCGRDAGAVVTKSRLVTVRGPTPLSLPSCRGMGGDKAMERDKATKPALVVASYGPIDPIFDGCTEDTTMVGYCYRCFMHKSCIVFHSVSIVR
jgi:hypothetical protein